MVAASAEGSPITYAYSGTIREAAPDSGVKVGDRFSGVVSYDPEGPVSISYNGGYGSKVSSDFNNTSFTFVDAYGMPAPDAAGSRMTLDVAGRNVFSIPDSLSLDINRTQYTGNDGTIYKSSTISFSPTRDASKLDGFQVFVQLANATYTAPGTLDKLPTKFDLSDYPTAILNVSDTRSLPVPTGFTSSTMPVNRGYTGVIDTFEAVPTPEPSTLALIGVGLAGWLIRGRKRRA